MIAPQNCDYCCQPLGSQGDALEYARTLVLQANEIASLKQTILTYEYVQDDLIKWGMIKEEECSRR